MTGRVLVLVAVGVVATGCVSLRTNIMKERSSLEAFAELERAGTPADVSLRERVQIAANDWIAGRVRESGETLVLQPYLPWEPELELPTYPGMPVLAGNAVFGQDRLRPGADVRAYLDVENGQAALVAVELLSPEEAMRLSSGLVAPAAPEQPGAGQPPPGPPPPDADPTHWEI